LNKNSPESWDVQVNGDIDKVLGAKGLQKYYFRKAA
jgi:hypothetical protein